MGLKKKQKNVAPVAPEPPKLARRHENRHSSFKMGRTIGEKRERLETANERAAARKKDKNRKITRVSLTSLGFVLMAIILISIFQFFLGGGESKPAETSTESSLIKPTIEIIDENAAISGGKISTRMESYIGQAERDFRDLGMTPVKAVIPSGAVREVDFYLDGHPGFVKMTIDRDSAVSVEDVERLYRYLTSIGVSDFSYIDVRIDNKAYWK